MVKLLLNVWLVWLLNLVKTIWIIIRNKIKLGYKVYLKKNSMPDAWCFKLCWCLLSNNRQCKSKMAANKWRRCRTKLLSVTIFQSFSKFEEFVQSGSTSPGETSPVVVVTSKDSDSPVTYRPLLRVRSKLSAQMSAVSFKCLHSVLVLSHTDLC